VVPTYTLLKLTENYGDSEIAEQLSANLVEFFNWAYLNIGAFSNVAITDKRRFWQNQEKLIPTHDDNFQDGQVWEGFRSNWVWETGIQYKVQPIHVSGVYINGTFRTLQSDEYINYPYGRVVLNTPLSLDTTVQVNYSYRLVNFYTSDQPWFDDVMFATYKVELADREQVSSGIYQTINDYRIQLPAIVIEPVAKITFSPKELGHTNDWTYHDVLFHVLTEEGPTRNKLMDQISKQQQHKIVLFDRDALLGDNKYPLDENGSPVTNPLTYPDMVAQYPWKNCTFFKAEGQQTNQTLPLFRGVVRATLEV
jgi:hypothetical protein